jgi:hypothetical protein
VPVNTWAERSRLGFQHHEANGIADADTGKSIEKEDHDPPGLLPIRLPHGSDVGALVARPVRSPLRAVDAIQNVSVAEDQRLLGDALEALAGTASNPIEGAAQAGGRERRAVNSGAISPTMVGRCATRSAWAKYSRRSWCAADYAAGGAPRSKATIPIVRCCGHRNRRSAAVISFEAKPKFVGTARTAWRLKISSLVAVF